MSWRHRGFTWKPRSSLTWEKSPMKLASGFCIPEPLPVHMVIKGRQVHPLIRFLLLSRVDEKCADLHKPFISYLFLVGVTVQSAESLSAAIPLGTSTKRENSNRANHGRSRLFFVLLVAVISCLRMTDTIVVFSVWASNTLKMRSWTTHVPVVGVWAWFRCDLAFPFWKDWHPLPPPVLVSLARAEDHRDERLKSQRGPSGRRCPPWWSRSAISGSTWQRWRTSTRHAFLTPISCFCSAPLSQRKSNFLFWRRGSCCPACLAGSHAQFDSATRFNSPGDLPSSTAFSRSQWHSGTPLSCARGLLSSWQRMQSSRSLQPRWGRGFTALTS